MSSDLIFLISAIALGVAIVVMGSRRNLSETTRKGLPRFEGPVEPPTVVPVASGNDRWRRPLSRRQRLLVAAPALLASLVNAASALTSADDRAVHWIAAALFALGAVVNLVDWPSRLSRRPAS